MNVRNRPGLSQLAYRIGTHASFFEAMRARLAASDMAGLSSLSTRDLSDPSLALLDAWAVVADILTFYQERIANEGYVGTATERRSIVELARLTGYTLRPGVAAAVYFAYTCERGGDVVIPAGSKAQSVPGPGELPQTFETSQPLHARDAWNLLGVRMLQPQTVTTASDPTSGRALYVAGTANNLKPNDALLFVDTAPQADPKYRVVQIASVAVQSQQQRTMVVLQGAAGTTPVAAVAGSPAEASMRTASGASGVKPTLPSASLLERYDVLEQRLAQTPAKHPADATRLNRSVAELLGPDRDAIPQLIAALHPELAQTIYPALANVLVAAPHPIEVHVFRAHTAPYGHNAPRHVEGYTTAEGAEYKRGGATTTIDYDAWPLKPRDRGPQLSLETRFDRIVPNGYVAENSGDGTWHVHSVLRTRDVTRNDYGLTANSTVLFLDPPYALQEKAVFADLAEIDIYAQSERLTLVDVPIVDDFPAPLGAAAQAAGSRSEIELDGLYDGLLPGRWALVTGTRADLPGVPGTELVMIAGTAHRTNPALEGDAVHTFVTLSDPLRYTYLRDSVAIYGNVVRATHGETRRETLGSGDASVARQRFALKASPLTFVSAPTPSGVASTLAVRVNDVLWHETSDVDALQAVERSYTTQTDDGGATTVVFGDGVHGARVPTGVENIGALYRVGIGSPGNVAAGAVSNLTSRPLGVKGVVNPQAASGGADPESRDDARANLARALYALDRLVSLDDYADFARTFAGVANASLTRVGSANAGTLYLTIAGSDDAAIDPAGQLVANLLAALKRYGDPAQAIEIVSRQRVVLVLSASVAVLPDYLWENVEPNVRAALVATFAFSNRDFGQPAYLGEAIATIQSVPGVDYANVDVFEAIHEKSLAADLAAVADPGGAARPPATVISAALGTFSNGTFAPAEIVTLDPSVPDTLVLRAIERAP